MGSQGDRFSFRFSVWRAINRVRRDSSGVYGPGAEKHHARVLLGLLRTLEGITDPERLQRQVDFFGVSKGELRDLLREYVRRVGAAQGVAGLSREQRDALSLDRAIAEHDAGVDLVYAKRLAAAHRRVDGRRY